jgi:hypothetical protein
MYKYIPTSQHGITTRGTNTAWREIINNAIDWENIYEYDLKGFFDNISNLHGSLMLSTEIVKENAKTGCNTQESLIELTKYVADQKRCLPVEEYEDRIWDFVKDPLICFMMLINESRPKWSNKATPEQLESDKVRRTEFTLSLNPLFSIGAIDSEPDPRSYIKYDKVIDTNLNVRPYQGEVSIIKKDLCLRGVPQGGPHSPLIAMLTKIVSRGTDFFNHIEYVDDGISDKKIEGIPEIGCEIAPLKSG